MALRECPSCALESDKSETLCPFCGYEFPEQKLSIWWFAVLFAALLVWPVISILKSLFQ